MNEYHHGSDQHTTVAIDISGPLRIKPGEIVKYLKIKIGEEIAEHGLLADKKSLLGKTEIKSPVAGLIVNIDTENGTVVIESRHVTEVEPEFRTEQSTETPVEVKDPSMDADHRQKIVQSENEEHGEQEGDEVATEIEIDIPDDLKAKGKKSTKKFARAVTKHKIKAIVGFGAGKGKGELVHDLAKLDLSPKDEGKILLVSELPSKLIMYKASAIGVEAVIVSGEARDEVEAFKREFEGKAQIGLLLVSKEIDMKKLDGIELEIKDEHLIVAI